MWGLGKKRTKVEEFKNESALRRGIERAAKNGYTVSSTVAIGGRWKLGKALLTGGLGHFTPGGLKRGEKYIVTFVLA